MKRYTVFPSVDEALHLHRRLIESFGGDPGVRDLGLLESVLARPLSGYYTTVFEQAAALLQSLIQNHAFLDRNKRMGFTMAAVFLLLNGYQLRVSAKQGESFIVKQVIGKRIELDAIAEWLKKHSTPSK